MNVSDSCRCLFLAELCLRSKIIPAQSSTIFTSSGPQCQVSKGQSGGYDAVKVRVGTAELAANHNVSQSVQVPRLPRNLRNLGPGVVGVPPLGHAPPTPNAKGCFGLSHAPFFCLFPVPLMCKHGGGGVAWGYHTPQKKGLHTGGGRKSCRFIICLVCFFCWHFLFLM